MTGPDRFGHEDTANDRWVGAMLDSVRHGDAAGADVRVERAVRAIRVYMVAPAPRTGRRVGWWRAPLAAAASIAVVAGAALLFDPRPASASALLQAARVAEQADGDRRYLLELVFPAHPGQGESSAPRATGTLDIRDQQHVRLDLRFDDGRTMTRAVDGATTWTNGPDGSILRVPNDAPWPRFIETPEGDLLADRLDVLLADVVANYRIERCDAGDAMRVCATKLDDGFRGPERIELTLDPATKHVRRAEFTFGAPVPRVDVAPRGAGGAPRGPDVRGGQGGPAAPRPGPRTMVIERAELPPGGLGADRFTPPSEPVRQSPAPRDGQPFGHERRPDGPPPFDREPGRGGRPPVDRDRGPGGPPPFDPRSDEGPRPGMGPGGPAPRD